MDVNQTTNFESFYSNKYKEIVKEYYDLVKPKKIRVIIFVILLGVLLGIMPTIFFNILKQLLGNYYTMSITLYYIVMIVITLYSIKKSLKLIMVEVNEYIIRDIIAFISNNNVENIMFEPKQRLAEEAFDKMNLFNLNIVKYNGSNYIRALYNKNTMVFSDMETYVIDTIETKEEIYRDGKKYIKTARKKKKRYIFKGIYIGATLNKKNTNHIYLIPNNLNDTVLQSKIMSYIKYHGVPANLENLEFSKKYKVFCDDEVQARYILSLGLMERINKLDELYKGKKYIVFKEGKRFAICIEGVSIENIKNSKMPLFRNEKIEYKYLCNIFNQLMNLFNIYYILDLGNELYTKYMNKPINNTIDEISNNNSKINNKIPAQAIIQDNVKKVQKQEITNREKLYNSMQLPQYIGQLQQEEVNNVITQTLKKINMVLKNIDVEQSNYILTNRQEKTKENAISKMKNENYLNSYYEIMDFVENYGDSHNGIVYEVERQEIKRLIILLYQKLNPKVDEKPKILENKKQVSKEEFLANWNNNRK